MENPIKQIYRFNQQANLLTNGYDDFLESSFQVEEALEGFDLPAEILFDVYSNVIIDSKMDKTIKDVSRDIVSWAMAETASISDVARLDKHLDSIVFAFGSIFKLGLDPGQATRALNVVMKANQQKLAMSKDSNGKLLKPDTFIRPEPELQAILDER